jgi:plasmid stabilization system protein ParE
MVEIVGTKRANRNFSSIIEYLKKEWGKKVTVNFVKNHSKIIELIKDHPEIGLLERPDKGISRFPITRHNRFFYRIANNQLILLNFFDNRQSPKKKKY